MRGSWSLGAVPPTIAPELLDSAPMIADGGMAPTAFPELPDTATEARRKMEPYTGLLEHLGRDTPAPVWLAHRPGGG